jgi:hypothetical protein
MSGSIGANVSAGGHRVCARSGKEHGFHETADLAAEHTTAAEMVAGASTAYSS